MLSKSKHPNELSPKLNGWDKFLLVTGMGGVIVLFTLLTCYCIRKNKRDNKKHHSNFKSNPSYESQVSRIARGSIEKDQ